MVFQHSPSSKVAGVKSTVAMVANLTSWNEEAYRSSIMKDTESHTRTVFRAIFAPSSSPNPDTIIAASSNGSVSVYSLDSCISSPPMAFSGIGNKRFTVLKPDCYLQGHDGAAYDVKFYGEGENLLLLSCGDDGRVCGWRWSEVKGCKASNEDGENFLEHVIEFENPQHKGPWGSRSPIPEVNAVATDTLRGCIYTAAGDCCAYCWDVVKGKVKDVFKGHVDYLHCVAARTLSNQIVTGSEDGTARLWDCRSGKCIEVMDVEDKMLSKDFPRCISSVALDASESWLACGSGKGLSVWNLHARECVSRITTRTAVQDLLFDGNKVLAVGAHPLLECFDMNGTTLSQIQCAPESSFSVSLHPSGVTAVAGYGGLVDVISQLGSHLCAFKCA